MSPHHLLPPTLSLYRLPPPLPLPPPPFLSSLLSPDWYFPSQTMLDSKIESQNKLEDVGWQQQNHYIMSKPDEQN